MMSILYLLPKNVVSRCFGLIMGFHLPRPLSVLSIRYFADLYKINVEEAERPLESYASIGEFFTRKLKDGIRPIAGSSLVHPADSKIAQIGKIADGQLVQAKGKTFSLGKLLQEEGIEKSLLGGLFATYYLCPTDYHRVHAPCAGKITMIRHIPGQLWPVNDWGTSNIDELFCISERVIVRLTCDVGDVFVVFVGATNVGKISLSFEPKVQTNDRNQRLPRTWYYEEGMPVAKGQELGIFHMGSTVVMLVPSAFLGDKPDIYWSQFKGKSVLVGGALS